MSLITHYLNSDFDLSLRPRPRQLEHSRLARQVRELSVHGLIGADAGDSVLVRAEVPGEFLRHLERNGIPVPRLLPHPRIDPSARFRPFGWSAEAIEFDRLHARPSAPPPLAVIRRVNSRSFALELERDLDPGGPAGTVIETAAALESFLATAPCELGWVVKSEHGHAGLANRRLAGASLTTFDRRFVEERLAEDDRMIVEPWLERERDWCTVFQAPFDRATLRVHETVCTGDGALIGALFQPHARWPEPLAATAERVASHLAGEGYFGPVCVDGFAWRDGGRSRVRPLVDLNGRLSMSDGAWRLWQRLAPERTFYYRFFNRRKLTLPAGLPSFVAELGRHAYDRSAGRGILPVSPLELGVDGELRQPAKLAVVFVADDRSGILALERWFRRRFEV